jgi:hypothetical protein
VNRLLLILLLSALLSVLAWAQDAEEEVVAADPEVTAAEEPEVPVEPEPEPEPDYDEAGLDEKGFDNEDDDFEASERIPTDQSIDFPTDI